MEVVMAEFDLLAVVALLRDISEDGLVRDQAGLLSKFSGDEGQTYASVTLKGTGLMRLHHEPVHKAA
jgi:hypothetical protein